MARMVTLTIKSLRPLMGLNQPTRRQISFDRAWRLACEIAAELYGAKRAAEWETDDWVRSRTRRRLGMAETFLKEWKDYRTMAARPG